MANGEKENLVKSTNRNLLWAWLSLLLKGKKVAGAIKSVKPLVPIYRRLNRFNKINLKEQQEQC